MVRLSDHVIDVVLPAADGIATIRTSLKAKDKFAVQNAISAGGEQTGGVLALMETALLARLLESWTLEAPLPGTHSCDGCTGNSLKWHEHVRDEFGDLLDIDDFNALEAAVGPLLEKVVAVPNLGTSSA